MRTAPPPAPRAEPWRRTSGMHRVRKPRALAAVRSLWEARDRLAAERDIAPGRVLPDAAIVDAATAAPATARRRSPRCRCSAGAPSGGSPPTGSRRSAQAAAARRRRAPARRPAERRPAAGHPLGRPRPGRRRAPRRRPRRAGDASARSAACRWRTCCSPTWCAACAGARRPTATSPPPSPRRRPRLADRAPAPLLEPALHRLARAPRRQEWGDSGSCGGRARTVTDRPPPTTGRGRHRAAVREHHRPHDRQAQPRAARRPGALHRAPAERLEQLVHPVRGHLRPAGRHPQLGPARPRRHSQARCTPPASRPRRCAAPRSPGGCRPPAPAAPGRRASARAAVRSSTRRPRAVGVGAHRGERGHHQVGEVQRRPLRQLGPALGPRRAAAGPPRGRRPGAWRRAPPRPSAAAPRRRRPGPTASRRPRCAAPTAACAARGWRWRRTGAAPRTRPAAGRASRRRSRPARPPRRARRARRCGCPATPPTAAAPSR